MEAMNFQQAYNEIVAYIKRQEGKPSGWYCGIASDWQGRLFNDHQVPRDDYGWIARKCYNTADARTVEEMLIRFGCDGGAGGGDETTIYVYAYLKRSMTNP
jgi:hypothetical protein